MIPEKNSRTGLSAELQLTAESLDRGLVVLNPVGDFLPYDLIISNGKQHLKVQVKASNKAIWRNSSRYAFSIKRFGGRYTKEQVDVFALYFKDIKQWAFIPFKSIKGTSVSFCGENSQNKYVKYINNWKIFEIKKPRRAKK